MEVVGRQRGTKDTVGDWPTRQRVGGLRQYSLVAISAEIDRFAQCAVWRASAVSLLEPDRTTVQRDVGAGTRILQKESLGTREPDLYDPTPSRSEQGPEGPQRAGVDRTAFPGGPVDVDGRTEYGVPGLEPRRPRAPLSSLEPLWDFNQGRSVGELGLHGPTAFPLPLNRIIKA